jgi:ribosomal protein L37AE/L43A
LESNYCEICGSNRVDVLVLRVWSKIFICAECKEDMYAEVTAELISNVQILIPKE